MMNLTVGAYKNAHGTCPTAVWLARQYGARGVWHLCRKIQLNIRFINPWTVNSNARGGELDLVTPFAGEFRLLTSATPPPTEFPCPGADYVYNVSVFGVSSAIHLYPVRFTCIQCDSRTGYPLNAIMRSLTPLNALGRIASIT